MNNFDQKSTLASHLYCANVLGKRIFKRTFLFLPKLQFVCKRFLGNIDRRLFLAIFQVEIRAQFDQNLTRRFAFTGGTVRKKTRNNKRRVAISKAKLSKKAGITQTQCKARRRSKEEELLVHAASGQNERFALALFSQIVMIRWNERTYDINIQRAETQRRKMFCGAQTAERFRTPRRYVFVGGFMYLQITYAAWSGVLPFSSVSEREAPCFTSNLMQLISFVLTAQWRSVLPDKMKRKCKNIARKNTAGLGKGGRKLKSVFWDSLGSYNAPDSSRASASTPFSNNSSSSSILPKQIASFASSSIGRPWSVVVSTTNRGRVPFFENNHVGTHPSHYDIKRDHRPNMDLTWYRC